MLVTYGSCLVDDSLTLLVLGLLQSAVFVCIPTVDLHITILLALPREKPQVWQCMTLSSRGKSCFLTRT